MKGLGMMAMLGVLAALFVAWQIRRRSSTTCYQLLIVTRVEIRCMQEGSTMTKIFSFILLAGMTMMFLGCGPSEGGQEALGGESTPAVLETPTDTVGPSVVAETPAVLETPTDTVVPSVVAETPAALETPTATAASPMETKTPIGTEVPSVATKTPIGTAAPLKRTTPSL